MVINDTQDEVNQECYLSELTFAVLLALGGKLNTFVYKPAS